MADIHFRPSGDDATGSGTDANPFRSFGQAYSVASTDPANPDTLIGDGLVTGDDMQILGTTEGYLRINGAGDRRSFIFKSLTPYSCIVTVESTVGCISWENADMEGYLIQIEDIVFDYQNSPASIPNYTIRINTDNTVPGTLQLGTPGGANAPRFLDSATFYAIFLSNQSSVNCFDYGAHYEQTTAAGSGMCAAIYAGHVSGTTHNLLAGDVIIQDGSCLFESKTVAVPSYSIRAAGPNVSARFSRMDINQTVDSSGGSNEFTCVSFLSIDDAVIEDSNLVGMSDSSLSVVALAVIDCADTSLTAHRGQIVNNTGVNGGAGGFLARLGHDGSGPTDHLANDGVIFNNDFSGTQQFIDNGGHGMYIGHETNCNASFNKANDVGVGLLCEGLIGGGMFANEVGRFGSAVVPGVGMQSKGCTDTRFFGNRFNISVENMGNAFVANTGDANFSGGSLNNLRVLVQSNMYNILEATDPSLRLNIVSVDQDIIFEKNNYLNTDEITNALPMFVGGASIDLDAFFAANEDDAAILADPILLDPASSVATYTLEIEASSTLEYQAVGGDDLATQFPAGLTLDYVSFRLSGGGEAIDQTNVPVTFPAGETDRMIITVDVTGAVPTVGQTLSLNLSEPGVPDPVNGGTAEARYAGQAFTVVGVA